jgi:hypothetical protein
MRDGANAATRKLNVPRLTKMVRPMKPVVLLCEGQAAATIVSPLALTSVLAPASKLPMSSAVS